MVKIDTDKLRHYECDGDDEIDVPYPTSLVSALPELVSRHGGRLFTAAIEEEPGVVVFTACNAIQYNKLSAAFIDDSKSSAVTVAKQIGYDCVVWPDRDTFAAIADRYPGVPIAVGNQAFAASAGRRATTKKKA